MRDTRSLLRAVLRWLAIVLLLVIVVPVALKGFDAYCAGRSNVVCD